MQPVRCWRGRRNFRVNFRLNFRWAAAGSQSPALRHCPLLIADYCRHFLSPKLSAAALQSQPAPGPGSTFPASRVLRQEFQARSGEKPNSACPGRGHKAVPRPVQAGQYRTYPKLFWKISTADNPGWPPVQLRPLKEACCDNNRPDP